MPATSRLSETISGISGCRREKASRRSVSCAARQALPSAADTIGWNSCPEVRRRSMVSRLPRITVSKLLKSCATPPVSWPIVSIFCAWRSRSSVCCRCFTSSATRSSSVSLTACSSASA